MHTEEIYQTLVLLLRRIEKLQEQLEALRGEHAATRALANIHGEFGRELLLQQLKSIVADSVGNGRKP